MATPKRGEEFERRVLHCLEELATVGFARDIRHQELVEDRDGNIRKIDISFILPLHVINLHITIECKSRRRSLSLDDVDQIRIFKESIPVRNLFWLICESEISSGVKTALGRAGISYYKIDEFERIVSDIVAKSKSYVIDGGMAGDAVGKKTLDLDSIRGYFTFFSAMHPALCGMFDELLENAEKELLGCLFKRR